MADVDGKPRIGADSSRINILGNRLLFREVTEKIIRAAYAVHSELGPGFLERVYVIALVYELTDRGVTVSTALEIPISFKGRPAGTYFADVIVDGRILIEVKAIRALAPEHQAQLLHYLTATGLPLGLLINFGAASLQFKRMAKTK